MKVISEEHSILKLAEGLSKGTRTVTLDAKDVQHVLDRVKSLEHALVTQIRSSYERQTASASESQAAS
jgi:hypothetical protein